MGFVKLLFPIVVVLAFTSGLARAWGQRQPAADLSGMDIEQLMQVNVAAASLHAQRLEDAPASVTIITQDDIRKYGYRTLAEALGGARGFYTSYDHTYHFEGVRGFSLPGDYGTRLLVMVNGHSMTDNILGQATWYGQDMALDMTLVKQIEIVRGPSSALYGSSGLFATINIVTLSPDEFKNTKVTAETGSFGEKKIQAATAVSLGHGAALLVSGSLLNNSGEHSLYFPEANSPATNYGRAIDVDGEKGYHLFADFAWHDWRVTSLFGARQKTLPISWGPTIFGDSGSRALDSRNFVDATYTHNFDSSRSLQWRTYYDSYRFRGVFRYREDVVEDNRVFFTGDWVGSQVNYRFPLPHFGSLTVGAAGRFDLRALQQDVDVKPEYKSYVKVDKRDKSLALFAQDELDLSSKWKLNLGARFDYSEYRPNSVSPRAALIYQPSDRVSYKFLYGRAFRNPTAFELFYDDGGQTSIGNAVARPEKTDTFEFVAERKLTRRVNALVSAYHYEVSNLLEGEYTTSGALQYVNGPAVRASGLEVEFNGRLAPWLEFTTSLAVQRTNDSEYDRPLPNSPGQVGKLRLSVPLFTDRLSLSGATQYLGSRQTLGAATLAPLFLSDLTVSSTRLTSHLDFQAGIRNIANEKHVDPIALLSKYDTIPAPGRTFFITLTWRQKPE